MTGLVHPLLEYQDHVPFSHGGHYRSPPFDHLHPHHSQSTHSPPFLCPPSPPSTIYPPCHLPPPCNSFSRRNMAPHALISQMVISLLPRPPHAQTLNAESRGMDSRNGRIRTGMADCVRNSRQILVEFTAVYFYRGDLDCVYLGTGSRPGLRELELMLARRRGIKRVWLYMLIGQLVAVSWASALFWAVWETSLPVEKKETVVYASRRLVWTTIAATITSFSLYYVVLTPYFLPLLLVVHFLLFLPLSESTDAIPSTISISQLYAINGTLSAMLHLGNCVWLFQRGELGSLWDVIWEHAAMSSVGWDAIFCAIIGVVGTRRILSITLPPAISLGGTMGGIHSIFTSNDYQE